MPINSFIGATEPLGNRWTDVLAEDIAVADSKFVVNYYRFSEDRRFLFGGARATGWAFPRTSRGPCGCGSPTSSRSSGARGSSNSGAARWASP
jgi:hypothetical protein